MTDGPSLQTWLAMQEFRVTAFSTPWCKLLKKIECKAAEFDSDTFNERSWGQKADMLRLYGFLQHLFGGLREARGNSENEQPSGPGIWEAIGGAIRIAGNKAFLGVLRISRLAGGRDTDWNGKKFIDCVE